MLKNPLSHETIKDNGNEYGLVLDILDTLRSKFLQYVEKRDAALSKLGGLKKVLDAPYNSDKEDAESKKDAALSSLESEYDKFCKESETARKDAKTKRSEDVEKAQKSFQTTKHTIENKLKTSEEYHNKFAKTERTIARIEPYKRLIDESAEGLDIDINDLATFCAECQPATAARAILKEYNDSGHLSSMKKLLTGSLDKMCLDFYSHSKKEKELYEAEIAAQYNKLEAAKKEQNQKIEKAKEDHDSLTQQIDLDCAAREKSYERGKSEINAAYERKTENLRRTHERNIKSWIINPADRAYMDEILHLIPRDMLNELDVTMREKDKRVFDGSFVRAESAPMNVTVGNVVMKREAFSGDEKVIGLLEKEYSSFFGRRGFCLPYALSLNEKSVMYKYTSGQADIAKFHLKTICLNAFMTMPPKMMRFHFIDPSAQNIFEIFGRFQSSEPAGGDTGIVFDGIAATRTGIEQKLLNLSEYIREKIDDDGCRNIWSYNNGNAAPLPHIILAVMDFPNGFSERAFEYLEDIVTVGKMCGVYCVIMNNTDRNEKPGPESLAARRATRGPGPESIERRCDSYLLGNNGYYTLTEFENEDKKWGDTLEFSIENHLLNPSLGTAGERDGKLEEIIEKVAPEVRQATKGDEKKVKILYSDIAPAPNEKRKGRCVDGLSIPIGRKMGGGESAKIEIGQMDGGQYHALIVGDTGTGKSTLIKTIIAGALQRYPEDELKIYLIDLMKVGHYKPYTEYELPNFEVMMLEENREFAVTALRELSGVISDRKGKFTSLREGVADVINYNNNAKVKNINLSDFPKLPRILVIIDGFHELFSGGSADITRDAKELTEQILRDGRAYGINMILAAHSPQDITQNISTAAMNQIAARIVFACSPEDAKCVLDTDESAINQIKKNDPGSAIQRSIIGGEMKSEQIRVAYFEEDTSELDEILLDIQNRYSGKAADTKILTSDVGRSRGNVFDKFTRLSENISSRGIAHFGEAADLRSGAPEAVFQNAGSENLLLVGGDDEMARNLLFFMTADLALQKIKAIREGAPIPDIYILNLAGGNPYLTGEDCLGDFGRKFSPELFFYADAKSSGLITEKLEEISKTAATHTARRDSSKTWLVISYMGDQKVFSRPVQGGITKTDASHENYEALEKILKSGPARGIHTIAWHKDYRAMEANFGGLLRYFEKRIAFKMDGRQANAFASVPENEECLKDTPGSPRNAFFKPSPDVCLKFRPYSTPDPEWRKGLYEKIRKEMGG